LKKKSIEHFPQESILVVDGTPIPIKSFSRPILRCVIQLPTRDLITVFVVHLKSKRPVVDEKHRHDQKYKAVGHGISLVLRAAEAAALRCILVDEMKQNSRPVILMGDLNDVVHSVTTEIVTGTQPWKKLSREQKEEIWDVLLWSTNEVQVRTSDRDVTYSHIHNGRYEVLDHILVSQEFVKSNPEHIGYVQFLQLFHDHLVDETLTEEKRDVTISDHAQIVASIKIFGQNQTQAYHQQQKTVQADNHVNDQRKRKNSTSTPPKKQHQQVWVKK